MRGKAWLWPLLATTGLIGCGGHGGGIPTPSGNGGRASLTVKWPARARLIPVSSNLLEVKLSKDGTVVATQKVPRPSGDQPTSTVAFPNLPYGELAVDVKAYPNADGSGVAQAAGAGSLEVSEDKPGTVAVALDSTVETVTIEGVPSAFATGDQATVTLSAKDKEGAVVLLTVGSASEPVAWSVGDESVATITGTGATAKLSGGAGGTTTLRASLKVKDGGPPKVAEANIKSMTRTFTLTTSDNWIYTWYPFAPLVTATVNPPFPTEATLDLQVEGPAVISGPIVLKANATTGYARISRFSQVEVDTPIKFTASYGSLTATKTGTLHPNPLKSVTGPETLAGGATGTGWVNLGEIALAPEEVELSCNDPSVVIPKKAIVPGPTLPGTPWASFSDSIDFKFTVPTVTAEKTIVITATRAGATKQWSVKIAPN